MTQPSRKVEVAGEGVLERCDAEELAHERVGVGAPLEVEGELEAGEVGLVAHVGDLADLAALHEVHDLVHDRLDRRGRGDLGDVDAVVRLVVAPAGAHPHPAASGRVDLAQIVLVVDDVAAAREVGGAQRLEDVVAGVFEQRDRRVAHLGEVEGADRAGHADRDADVGVDKDRREGHRKKGRLLLGVVVVVDHVDGVLVDVAEELRRDRVELDLGVTGGSKRHIAGVCLTEVTLGIDIRVQQRFVSARQSHHRFIDCHITVWIQLHGGADHIGRFGPCTGQQSHLIHGVQQLAMRGLEAVYFGDRPGYDDTHRVGHIVFFQRIGDLLIDHLARVLDVRLWVVFMHRGRCVLFSCHDYILCGRSPPFV